LIKPFRILFVFSQIRRDFDRRFHSTRLQSTRICYAPLPQSENPAPQGSAVVARFDRPQPLPEDQKADGELRRRATVAQWANPQKIRCAVSAEFT
jgi:hypothetical protein